MNIRIIQTIIDNNRYTSSSLAKRYTGNEKNTNVINAGIQIADTFDEKNIDLGLSAADIVKILYAGDTNKDGRLYDNQIDNGTAALFTSSFIRKIIEY